MEYLIFKKEKDEFKIIGHLGLIKSALMKIGKTFSDEKDSLKAIQKAMGKAMELKTEDPLEEVEHLFEEYKDGDEWKLKIEDITKDNRILHLKAILLAIFIEKSLKGEAETDEELEDLIDFVLSNIYKGAKGVEK